MQDEPAQEAGLHGLEQWQHFMERHIFTIAEQNKIPQKNLQWAAAFHDKKGQPHLHVVFWDKESAIQRQFVHPSIPNKIRQKIIKDTFADRIFEMGSKKTELTKQIRGDTKGLGGELLGEIALLGKRRYELIRSIYREGASDYEFQFDKNLLNVIAPKLFELKENIPSTGRLSYQLLPTAVKDQVDEMVTNILANSPELRGEVAEYVQTRIEQAELYGKVSEEKKQGYRQEAEKLIGNGVMDMVRSLNKLEWDYQKEHYEPYAQTILADQLLCSISELFRQRGTKGQAGKRVTWSSLSKEAQRELAMKHQDKGYEH